MIRLGHTLPIKTEVGFNAFLPGYVAAGAGLTVVPRILAENLHYASLTAIPISDEGFERDIALVILPSGEDK